MSDDEKLRRSSVHVQVGDAERTLFRLVADDKAAYVRGELAGDDFEGPYGQPADRLNGLGMQLAVASLLARAADADRVRLGYRELVSLFLFDFESVADQLEDFEIDEQALELAEVACDAILARWKAGETFMSAFNAAGDRSSAEDACVSPEQAASARYRQLLGPNEQQS